MLMNSVGQEFGQNTVGWLVSMPRCVWGHSWEVSKAGVIGQLGAGNIWRFTHSHVWQLMLAVGWDPSWDVSQNTHAWPLHVTRATSQHGSLRVVGLPTSQGSKGMYVSQLTRQKLHCLLWPSLRSHTESLLLHSVGYKWVTSLPRLNGKDIRHHLLMRKRQSSRRHVTVFGKCHLHSQVFPH